MTATARIVVPSRLAAAGAAGGGAAHGRAADGLVDPVEAWPPRRGPPGPSRRRGLLLGQRRLLLLLLRACGGGDDAGEERLDGVGGGGGGGAALARERGEAVHEAGEVDGGGLGLEHRLREEEVDGAGLERVVGAERPAAGLQQVRRRAQHVARRRGGAGGGGGVGRRGAVSALLVAAASSACGGGGGVAAGDVRDGDDARAEEVLDVPVGVDDADARGAGAQRPRRRRRREGAAHPCLILRSGSRSGSGVSGGSGQLALASGIGDAEEATRDGGGREEKVRAAGDRREARAAFIRRLASRRGREGGHSSRSRGAWESQSSPLVGVGRGAQWRVSMTRGVVTGDLDSCDGVACGREQDGRWIRQVHLPAPWTRMDG